jgi:hypothetical protein
MGTPSMVTLAPLNPEHLDHYMEWFADPEVTPGGTAINQISWRSRHAVT